MLKHYAICLANGSTFYVDAYGIEQVNDSRLLMHADANLYHSISITTTTSIINIVEIE